MTFAIHPLTPQTWPAYAALVERNRGVWGGCWCMAFHKEGIGRPGQTPQGNRAAKEARVMAGKTHAALVFQGEDCLGWCQFGPTAELPRIKNRKAYDAGLTSARLPDWRITCFFVDPAHRRRGVADAALSGAVALIAQAGGGVVEGYPDAPLGRTSASFLFNGTLSSFERQDFARTRQIGKTRWVLARVVAGV
jgi:GNAT superfamily N-acetyltransferase